MAIELPYYPILKIPDSEPDAIPELWNATYEQIDENLFYLQSEFNSALLSISDLTSQLANALLAISDLESQLAGATNPDTGGGGDTSGGENSVPISTTVIFEGRAEDITVENFVNTDNVFLYLITIQWGPNESDTMIDAYRPGDYSGAAYSDWGVSVNVGSCDILKCRISPTYTDDDGNSYVLPYVVRKLERVDSWNGEIPHFTFPLSSSGIVYAEHAKTIFLGRAENYLIHKPGVYDAHVVVPGDNNTLYRVIERWVVPDVSGGPWDGRQGRGEETFSHISRVDELFQIEW